MVGATQVPHAEILEVVKPQLAKEGVELDIKVFSDCGNLQLNDKQLDANFFQHKPYLESFSKDRKAAGAGGPGARRALRRLLQEDQERLRTQDGATIAIPNDPSTAAAPWCCCRKQGLVKLKDPSNILATAADVIENPKKLKFRELEAAMLPRSLDDVDLALINTNYALEAGLVPTKDALFIEGSDSPYANVLVTRADNKDAPAIKKLVNALHTPEVKKFIQEKYKGAVVPAF